MAFQQRVLALSVNSVFRPIIFTSMIAILLRLFVLQPFQVSGQSMLPNYVNGESVLVWAPYRLTGGLRTGDVIVFRPPIPGDYEFIKRVIATPDETVAIRDGIVYVNGRRLQETWETKDGTSWLDHSNLKPQTVRPGHVFVLGDNRRVSYDSRYWGEVPYRNIAGTVFLQL